MNWSSQGNAAIASVTLTDGRTGSAVIVGPRSKPKGVVVIIKAAESGEPETLTLTDCLGVLKPTDAIDILCMQERLHGESGLTPPAGFGNGSNR